MQVSSEKIEKLDKLVSKYIEEDKNISNVEISRLTAPGENYGSTMLKVDLLLEDKKGEKTPLSVVAKLIPEKEIFQKIFNIHITFKIEAAFYSTIIPTLQEFQREQGVKDVVDFFPKFYGARLNLDNSDNIDGNAVLLLENLKTSGYENLDRHVGCDLQAAKFILKDLSKFHAVPLAIKVLKPQIFDIKIKKYMACFNIETDEHQEEIDPLLEEILKDNEECKPLLPLYRKAHEASAKNKLNFTEPFATLSHQDMWVNNFMVKLENGKVVKNKFVDFQNYTYQSLVGDLLFFLFTSIQMDVLKEHLDNLITFYHQEFIQTLKDHRCPIKDFSYEKFVEELNFFAIYEFCHISFFNMYVVLSKKGGSASEYEATEDGPPTMTKEQVPEFVKEKLCWTFLEFNKRNWLKG